MFLQEKSINVSAVPRNSTHINFSAFRDFSSPLVFRSFSIKYVVEGTELYTVNGLKYAVRSDEYLLANTSCEGHVKISSASPVKGICIDIAPELLSEAWTSYHEPSGTEGGHEPGLFFHTAEFPENRYHTRFTHLGKTLQQLGREAQQNTFSPHTFTQETCFTLAENIVQDHLQVSRQLSSISAVKTGTKKELYRKVSRGKEWMDTYFSSSLRIEDIARESALSEYHFFRLFKMMYHITPHHYILQKRLETGKNLLLERQMNISEAAIYTGFPDIYSFSKAFKKHFGISPSALSG